MRTPLKWLGNKHKDWKKISPLVRLDNGGRFFEFCGGSFATGFNLLAREGRSIESHWAEPWPENRLIVEMMRDDPSGLIAALPRERSEELFRYYQDLLWTRKWNGKHPAKHAALCLYVMKNRFKPMFRPGGYQRKKNFYVYENVVEEISFFSPLLQQTHLYPCFSQMPDLRAGDFAFIDPPYVRTIPKFCYGMRPDTDLVDLNQRLFDRANRSAADYLLVTGHDEILESYFYAHGARIDQRPWFNTMRSVWDTEIYVTR